MSRIDETIQAKIEKRRQLEAAGVLIHPYSFEKTHTVAQARESEGKTVQTAGRIMAWRAHGKVVFADLVDQSGKIQVLLHASALTPEAFAQLSFIDPGDFLAVTGTITVTRTGELTIQASEYQFMGKTLRPIPTAWNQAEDKEVRFRRRYLDMLINADTRKVLDARWLIEKETRRYLQDQHNFTEVETPVLQALYGGTNAKPFTTHMNALDTDYYLRLAPELYLKRLIVGGYERIFEIARNFRNEGIDQTHQPEFTMIEWYEAYADYHRMMDVAEGLVRHLVQKLHGTTKMKVKDHEIDVGGKWPRLTMTAALLEHVGIDVETTDDDGLKALLTKHALKPIGEFSRGKAIFSLFDHLVPEHLIQPTWIIDYPKEVSPLAKQHRLNPELVERFEGYIAGKEIGDGWSEITDALDQRSRFENEQLRMRQGDAEAHPVDEDFLEAMEHGMPPLGGIGIGIDRLVMFLTNTWSIREVIAFPTLRPVGGQIKVPVKVANIIFAGLTGAGVHPEVTEQFPGMFFAQVLIKGVEIKKQDADLEAAKAALLSQRSKLTLEEIENIKPIAAYRELFRATKVDLHKQRPSPEALLRRIVTGKGLYTINTAVDAYNLAVVETGVGLGGFNAAKVAAPVQLRFSQAGEKMLLLGDDEATTTRAGELVYADQQQLLTLDLNYRDISATKITEKTTDIWLFADGGPGLDKEEVLAALKKGADYIVQYCGGEYGEIELISDYKPLSGETTQAAPEAPVQKAAIKVAAGGSLPDRAVSEALLDQYVKNDKLAHHCRMVAAALEAYAKVLGEDAELWYQTGLLHDLDWEMFPDEHPNKAVAEFLTEYPAELRQAILAHAPERTNTTAETLLDRYLFACDELSGLMHAASLMRPTRFADMEVKSVKKKLKDKSFAANVSREDIENGMTLIGKNADDHIAFLIQVFQAMPATTQES